MKPSANKTTSPAMIAANNRIVERSQTTRAVKAREGGTSKLMTLTPRELHVLTLIGRGLSRNEIAKVTHRSVKTIDTHRASIMEKLDINDRVELARYALREGLAEA